MVAFNKFQTFVGDLGLKVHQLDTDNLFVLLTNTSPNAADNVVDTSVTPCVVKATSNGSEIAAGNGYVKKGKDVTGTYSQAAGVGTLGGTDMVWTAAGGTIGPFRYAVLFNDTGGAAATRPVIGWWDYGSPITLNDGETLTFDIVTNLATIT